MLKPLEELAIYPDQRHAEIPFATFRPPNQPTPVTTRWVALHPGSGGKKKCWPIESFIQLAEKLQHEKEITPVFITGDVERETIPDLEIRLTPFKRIHQSPITELASHLTTASAFVGNDAGITHLAALAGIPTLALFGPTDPAMWGPRGRFVTIIASPTGLMNDLRLDSVWSALSNSL
jgi:heptosyltransferase-3